MATTVGRRRRPDLDPTSARLARRAEEDSAPHGLLRSNAARRAETEAKSGRPDLNRGPHRPERCALPGCATPRGTPVSHRPRGGSGRQGRSFCASTRGTDGVDEAAGRDCGDGGSGADGASGADGVEGAATVGDETLLWASGALGAPPDGTSGACTSGSEGPPDPVPAAPAGRSTRGGLTLSAAAPPP